MQIRKFKGEEMSDILRTIHNELGPDAVILLTREMKEREKNGSRAKIIEVTAATEGLWGQADREKTIKTEEKPKTFDRQLEAAIQGDIYKELASIQGKLTDLDALKRPIVEDASRKMHETWLEMKTMLQALSASRYEDPFFSSQHSLFELFQKLRAHGIDSQMAKSLCEGVKAALLPQDLQVATKLNHSIKGLLASTVSVTGGFNALDAAANRSQAKVLALVGPTGVGKSTTLAKIAAIQIQKKRKVTLVSFDRRESRDEDRLMRYARRFAIPAFAVRTLEAFQNIFSKQRAGALILIDTVGCGHFDQQGLALLKELSVGRIPIETHLVLSAMTKASDMSDLIDGFSILSIDSLLFTKIDETRHYGPLFSMLGRKRKPVSFLTTGRRVPEDIEAATPQRFSELVFQGQEDSVHPHAK